MTTAHPRQTKIATGTVAHSYGEPTDVRHATGNSPLLLELVETAAFQRLRGIHFLGAIDYRLIPRPNGRPGATRHSRYEHSLGVMRLARLYCLTRGISEAHRQLACVAALLHDIGHPPLSHSMEPVFKEEFGIDHHTATEDIICGRVSLGREVFSVLQRHNVDVEELINVVSGQNHRFHGFFSGPISFDTIEGILRAFRYIRPDSTSLTPDVVAKAAIRRRSQRDKNIVDSFWRCKHWVYRHIINSPQGVLSDLACQAYLRCNLQHIRANDYFNTETAIFRKLPNLRGLLTSHSFDTKVMELLQDPVRYQDRSYYIDQEGDFFAWLDSDRYRHTRRHRTLTLNQPNWRPTA